MIDVCNLDPVDLVRYYLRLNQVIKEECEDVWNESTDDATIPE